MTDINIGEITEALNDKSDRDMRNVDNTAGADAVIEYQVPTADNNYTWYRKYKSGWVEQGGYVTNAPVTINLPVEMADTNYTAIKIVNTNYDGNTNSVTWSSLILVKVSTKQVKLCQTSGGPAQSWMVCGIAAS